MPSRRPLANVLRNRDVPRRTRRNLFLAEMLRRFRPQSAYRIGYGPAVVFLSHDDYAIDWKSLKVVIADRAYPADHNGAVVLDVGAHKGYYGAFAFAGGARTVISFEPEQANVEYLERAASAHRSCGADWRVRAVAVGAERGEAELHVMNASWGHSLHPPDEWAEYEVGTSRVRVEAMSDVLAEGEALAGDSRFVVKLNVEGEECEIVLRTPPDAWRRVDELFIEVHPWGRCDAPELVEHLEPAGLRQAPSPVERVLRLRRAGAHPSGRRSGPT